METIDVFFYKLSRMIIVLRESFQQYYFTSTKDEVILFYVLMFVIVVFLASVYVLLLRLHFNRRIRKYDFVTVTPINLANETFNKNIFARFFLSIINFRKMTILEGNPFAEQIEKMKETLAATPIFEETQVEKPLPVFTQPLKQVEPTIEKPVKKAASPVFLSKDVEDYIEERITLRTLSLEESLQEYVINILKSNGDFQVHLNDDFDDVTVDNEKHQEVASEVHVESAPEIKYEPVQEVHAEPVVLENEPTVDSKQETLQVEPEPAVKVEDETPLVQSKGTEIKYEPTKEVYAEPAVLEQEPTVDNKEEVPQVEPEPIVEPETTSIVAKEIAPTEPEKADEPEQVNDDDFDPFFDEDKIKKYIVSKHPISGWQVRKVGSKRASRLFNTKKQAINYATKQKLDYEIQ